VGVGKRRAARHEAVDVRGFGLRMTAKIGRPVIQIIDSDEKHIWPYLSGGK
jgi:hypothetical protein